MTELVLAYAQSAELLKDYQPDSLPDLLLVLPVRLFLTCPKVSLTHVEKYTGFVHF